MDRELDFIVIGVQKGGTTSLWQYLRGHPMIAMPDYKEASVFCVPADEIPEAVERFMRLTFANAPAEAKLGKVSTHYMMGAGGRIDVDGIVDWIARTFPRVRLLSMLRDPIERAISHYRMSVRRGFESRTFDRVVEELLDPARLDDGRGRATETNSYLAQGEYGRILRRYVDRFGRERLHVEHTGSLSADPGSVLDRVLAFLDLPPGYRPEDLGERHYRGGLRARLDADGEKELRAFMESEIWPRVGADRDLLKMSFDFFLQTWNVIPDEDRPALSAENRTRLESHYRADAESLSALGIDAPWLGLWEAGEPSEPTG